jgi:hypothetical protein
MNQTTQTADGTSFHGDTFRASVSDLRKICGEPTFECNDGSDKVNFDWTMETSDGEVFTIYDWKEYRSISESEMIKWHVGGHNGYVTKKAVNEIASALNNLD